MLRAAGGGISAANGIQILAKSAVAASCPADTNENVLATVTVPANAMGPNGWVRITSLWAANNNANGKSIRVRWGGVGGSALISLGLGSNASAYSQIVVANRNATNSQIANAANGVPGVFGNVNNAPAVDTTQSFTIVFTGQKTVAGDTITLDGYLVELMYGA